MVKGTNKDSVSSIYNYNALGVLVGNDIVVDNSVTNDINSNVEPQVKLPTLMKKEFTIDYTKFIPSDLVESQDSGVSLKYTYAGRHKLSASVNTETEQEKLFYHSDRLGSSIFVSDVTGEVKAVANFDEWGNRQQYDVLQVGESQLDLVKSYTGHNYDNVLGVYYAKARMYNSKDKRFLAEDILKGVVQSQITLVAYSYVLDNPLNYLDLDGKDAIWLTDDRGAFYQGHSSILIQDKNGTWYHFNFGPGEGGGNNLGVLTLEKAQLPSTVKIDTVNATITNSKKPATNTNKKEANRYTTDEAKVNSSVATGIERYLDDTGDFQYYIRGDFTESYERAKEYVKEQPGYSIHELNCAWTSLDALMASYDEGSAEYNEIYDRLWRTKLNDKEDRKLIRPDSFNNNIEQLFSDNKK